MRTIINKFRSTAPTKRLSCSFGRSRNSDRGTRIAGHVAGSANRGTKIAKRHPESADDENLERGVQDSNEGVSAAREREIVDGNIKENEKENPMNLKKIGQFRLFETFGNFGTGVRNAAGRLMAAVMIFAVVLSVTACGNGATNPGTPSAGKNQGEKSQISVVATTTFLYDLAKVLVGDQVEVTSLMGVGIDPHQYKASAGDIEKLSKAGIVLYHGLHLEGKMGDIFAGLEQQGKKTIAVEHALKKEELLADEENAEAFDPHVWFDVLLWKKVAQYVAQEFTAVEGLNAEKIKANLAAYEVELDQLHAYVKTRAEELSAERRVLITAHDAFRYFGQAYGFEVKGLQGISTEAEAGINDVTTLADFITERKITAIFVETSVSQKNIESLRAAVQSKGGNVELGGELYSDSLGDEASGHATYVTTIRANIDTIVDALKK